MRDGVGQEVQRELIRAGKSLAAAKALLKEGLLEDSLSRSYYAVLHAARALLIGEGFAPQSHEAVKRLFGLHLVNTGKLDTHHAHILREAQDDRALADYDVAFVPQEERVRQRVSNAELFVTEALRFLGLET
ncbi:MAG: HEPN domain-containing protein [Planctomycetota bacterium]